MDVEEIEANLAEEQEDEAIYNVMEEGDQTLITEEEQKYFKNWLKK